LFNLMAGHVAAEVLCSVLYMICALFALLSPPRGGLRSGIDHDTSGDRY
jgi:hypothetical protein